jgi:hypothetical protein
MDVVVQDQPMTAKEEKKREPNKWEIDSWWRTLVEAEEIKADEEKMKYLRPKLDTKIKAIKSLEALRSVAKTKIDAEESDAMSDE